MLLSMTGFGEAHEQREGLAVTCEVRAINSRYFKITVRTAEGYAALEPDIESLVRQRIRRGTIQVNLWVDRRRAADEYRINVDVLDGYRRQLEALYSQWHVPESVGLDRLLLLPGVIDDAPRGLIDTSEDWPMVQRVLEAALAKLGAMRRDEGQAMAVDLRAQAGAIARELASIETRGPLVVESYRARLTERLTKLLADYEITLNPSDLIKEISIFSERSDISEEIVRLRSHLEQFESTLADEESAGRKLEFLVQEMFRETNTIGSKSSDVEIARGVIEIKAAIEKIRELVQNVE